MPFHTLHNLGGSRFAEDVTNSSQPATLSGQLPLQWYGRQAGHWKREPLPFCFFARLGGAVALSHFEPKWHHYRAVTRLGRDAAGRADTAETAWAKQVSAHVRGRRCRAVKDIMSDMYSCARIYLRVNARGSTENFELPQYLYIP